jgi:hypothetical protein
MSDVDVNREKLTVEQRQYLLSCEKNYMAANEQFEECTLYGIKKQYEETLTPEQKLENTCDYLKKFFYAPQNFRFLRNNKEGVQKVLEYISLRKKAILSCEKLVECNRWLVSLYPSIKGNFTRVEAAQYYNTPEKLKNCDSLDFSDVAFYSDVEQTYELILRKLAEAPNTPSNNGGSKSRRTRRRKHRHNRKSHHKHARKTHHKRKHHSHSRSRSHAARKYKKYTYRRRK